MGIEIERKFLVDTRKFAEVSPKSSRTMRQGYLNRTPGRTVRVRVEGTEARLTVKGAATGLVRPEFEYSIPLEDAESLFALCDGPLVEKVRHLVDYAGLTWEVDVFSGDNSGLVVAELELDSEEQTFEMPPWVGREVTGEVRYHNSHLAVMPYKIWLDVASE